MGQCLRGAWRRWRLASMVVIFVAIGPATGARGEEARTRHTGLRAGPHAVGFEFRTVLDPTRQVTKEGGGTPLGMAVWYPAVAEGAGRPPLTHLEYRLLQFATPPGARERQMFEAEEAAALPVWRHVGIVDRTEAQAAASLHAGGIAVRGASRARGRHPVVIILGGAYYLSTTAEWLASHGFLVVAASRFSDRSNEVGSADFSWYLENGVRDAEFALSTLQGDADADLDAVAALGHGGGGMQAMLFAMRNRRVRSLVNIDAGNFGARSGARNLPFYSPRLLRVPFLYIATSATRASQDQFEDFHAMSFSERYEVIVQSPDIRHHDLSDVGRAVTEPLRIRGTAQERVQQVYVDVHEMVLRFLREQAGTASAALERFAVWVAGAPSAGSHAVTAYPRVEPAPTVVDVEGTLSVRTAALLRETHARDPHAPLFEAANLLRVARKAMAAGAFPTAAAVADYAGTLHPTSPLFADLKSEALEGSGALDQAQAVAIACAAMPPGGDWRFAVAVRRCSARTQRLSLR